MAANGLLSTEVVGSNPIAPTFRINHLRASRDARFAFAVTFAATSGLESIVFFSLIFKQGYQHQW
jgi:hypothetical protein